MPPQSIVFSYHKSGTSLLLHVMTKVGARLGLRLVNRYGMVEGIDGDADVALLPHSLLRGRIERPYRAIRMIRDPRDLWVSGYLYHRRCDEEWCLHSPSPADGSAHSDAPAPAPAPAPANEPALDDGPGGSRIGWPRVDHSFAHWPEGWKRRYLARLDGKSYRRNLLDRSLAEGLDFELEGYTGCTLATLRDWGRNGVEALDIRLEDAMADFDGTMRRVFDHLGLDAAQAEAALTVARTEDIRRMDDAALANRPQVTSREISKWRAVLPAAHVARFEACHGDLIRDLGYALSGDGLSGDGLSGDGLSGDGLSGHGPSGDMGPEGSGGAPEPWLLADGGVVLRPMATGRGAAGRGARGREVAGRARRDPGEHVFVVPAGTGRLWLRSRRAVPPSGSPVPGWAAAAPALRVGGIRVQAQGREERIAMDDPRLRTGWRDPEWAEDGLWRLTEGAAELPWNGVEEPAVVTLRCAAEG